jgi:hypothetical protein
VLFLCWVFSGQGLSNYVHGAGLKLQSS